MIEDELGAMAKRIAVMVEGRCSDHAVGLAVLELAEMAMNAVIERQMASATREGTFGRPLTSAEKMDLQSGIIAGMELGPDDDREIIANAIRRAFHAVPNRIPAAEDDVVFILSPSLVVNPDGVVVSKYDGLSVSDRLMEESTLRPHWFKYERKRDNVRP